MTRRVKRLVAYEHEKSILPRRVKRQRDPLRVLCELSRHRLINLEGYLC